MKNSCARLLKTLSVSALCLAFVACSKSGSDTPSAAAPSTLASENSTDATSAMRSESSVTGREFSAGESSSGGGSKTLDQILAEYPVLADRAAILTSIDRVVETDAGTWDLYANGMLVMTLANNGAGGLTVVSATGGFAADSVMLVSDSSGEQNQGKSSNGIHFVMSACHAEDKEPTQEQEQDKTPVQEGDKTPEQEQDKTPVQEGDKAPEQEQDKTPVQEGDKAPEQEQDKEESKVEECASIEATLWLEEIVQKEEQEQDKTPEQEQDKAPEQEQDKTPEQEQDKTPEQEQDKTPEQEQDKTPEQEQDKTPEQEQDKTPEQEQDKTPEQEQDKKN